MCIAVPMPCPVYSSTTPYRPDRATLASTACPMSPSLPPPRACAIPCHSASSHARSSAACSAVIVPTPTVTAASPCHPLTMAPQSMEMMSPSASRRSGLGMPCTISSFTDVHSVAGYPW